LSLSESQEVSSPGVHEIFDHPTKTANSGNAEQTIQIQQSTPATVHETHSPKSPSISVSISNSVSSGSSSSIAATGIPPTGSIAPGYVYSTTLRPEVEYYSNPEGLSSGERVSQAKILLDSNSQPFVAALTSSAQAPLPTGVSLEKESQSPSAVSNISSESALTPPKVKEVKVIPQAKTIVEVQKAIALHLSALAAKPNAQLKPNLESTTPAALVSFSEQTEGKGKQDIHSSSQQHIFNGDFLQYNYGEPLTALQEYPQLRYAFPHITGPINQVIHEYSPQIFEPQKLFQFRYKQDQLYGVGQYEAPYEHSFEQHHEYTQKQPNGQLQALSEYQDVTETEKTREKYQQTQNSASNLNNYQQQKDAQKQPVTTTYNQILYDGQQQVLIQKLPEGSQVEGENRKKFLQAETDVQKPPAQIIHELKYQPPVENNHVTYQLLGQQIDYEAPVEVYPQIEYLRPTKLNHAEQTVNTELVQSGSSQQTISTPDNIVQITQGNTEGSRSRNQPLYNRNPSEVSKQLQSEYSRQLLEEEKQQQVKLSSQIGKALKQINSEYNEARVETQFPVHIPKEEKFSSLPAAEDVPALPSTAVVQQNQPHQSLELQKPGPIREINLVTVEKRVPVHHTSVIEKPIPVPHAVPVEITKLVAVDRPVPYAVPHPVPVPYVVPHPIEVPVPHLVPYPHVVTVPYKEIHPVYIPTAEPQRNELPLYHDQIQNNPTNTPLPAILKALQYSGGRYGVPGSSKPQSVFLMPPPLKSGARGRGLQHSKYSDNLRTLCIEYGFKPPLVPSLQIDEFPLPSYAASRKD
jgi:hypothetical protein